MFLPPRFILFSDLPNDYLTLGQPRSPPRPKGQLRIRRSPKTQSFLCFAVETFGTDSLRDYFMTVFPAAPIGRQTCERFTVRFLSWRAHCNGPGKTAQF